jgi:hypothetical protein
MEKDEFRQRWPVQLVSQYLNEVTEKKHEKLSKARRFRIEIFNLSSLTIYGGSN